MRLFCLIIFFPLILFSQEKKPNPVLDSLLNQAEYLYARGKYISAAETSKQALKQEGVKTVNILYKIFFSYLSARDSVNAIKYLRKADSLVTPHAPLEWKMNKFYYHGVYNFTYYRETEAVENLLKAEEIAEKLNDVKQQQLDKLLLGNLFLEQKNYPKSQKYLKESYRLSQQLKDSLAMAHSMLYMGKWYFNQKKNKEADSIFRKSLQIFEKRNDIKAMIVAKGYIAQLYLRKGDFFNSLKLTNETAELINQLELSGKLKKMVNNLNKQQELMKDTLQPDSVRIQKSMELTQENMQLAKEQVAVLNISSSSEEILKQDPQMTLPETKYIRQFNARFADSISRLKDSIWQKRLDSKYAEIEAKYQTEKKEKENLMLKAQKAEQAVALQKLNQRKKIFAGGLIFALLLLVIFGYYFRRNKKQKELIENLQKELHHRVKNNLTIIDSLVEDIKDDIESPEILNRLTELQNRIESINEVHRQLYRSEELTELNLKKYVEKLAESIQQSFARENIRIDNRIAENSTIPVEKSFPVGLIINEFITNSFKYAFDKHKEGLISIKLIEKAKSYLLLLADNGKGLPEDLDLKQLNSFGMNIMRLLSKQLGGEFIIDERKNGLRIKIEFPK